MFSLSKQAGTVVKEMYATVVKPPPEELYAPFSLLGLAKGSRRHQVP